MQGSPFLSTGRQPTKQPVASYIVYDPEAVSSQNRFYYLEKSLWANLSLPSPTARLISLTGD